ncbi:rRNA maturation RNase YbeY [Candidatus Nomurabacteria bacterium]|nr:rRNA maturation RNase YbeY [Candidatus Nomurabacteria bacterium]USN95010.1 MAG: rRNA maturation RNase YbeY [Candidatus Nomurabacteria bacterium]
MNDSTLQITKSHKGPLPSVAFLEMKNKILGKKYELSIYFADPKTSKSLNKKYRNKTYIPDVLSFPLTEYSGEIVACLDVIYKKYKEEGFKTKKSYLSFMIIHSMLHLKGFDHGTKMEKEEEKYKKIFC